jgi:hypothetical protein
MPTARLGGTVDHYAHAFITAHRINCDTREAHERILRKTVLETDSDDFATVIVTAGVAQIVRTLELTTVGAFVESLGLQRIMGTTVTATVRRNFSLRDSHSGTCSLVKTAVC